MAAISSRHIEPLLPSAAAPTTVTAAADVAVAVVLDAVGRKLALGAADTTAAAALDVAAIAVVPQHLYPDADLDAADWIVAPLYSKVSDTSDATTITAVCS